MQANERAGWPFFPTAPHCGDVAWRQQQATAAAAGSTGSNPKRSGQPASRATGRAKAGLMYHGAPTPNWNRSSTAVPIPSTSQEAKAKAVARPIKCPIIGNNGRPDGAPVVEMEWHAEV